MPTAFETFLNARNVKITSVYGAAPHNPDFEGSHAYKVTLRYQGRRLTVPFYMGPAHTKEPTAAGVLSCLISDAQSTVNARSFEEWASDLGYDADSRKAEHVYKACEQIERKLRRFLRDDYAAFVDASAD